MKVYLFNGVIFHFKFHSCSKTYWTECFCPAQKCHSQCIIVDREASHFAKKDGEHIAEKPWNKNCIEHLMDLKE